MIKWYKMVQVNPEKLSAHHLWVIQYEVYNYVQLSSIKLIMNVLLTLFWPLQGAYIQRPKIHISLTFGIPVSSSEHPNGTHKPAQNRKPGISEPRQSQSCKKRPLCQFFKELLAFQKSGKWWQLLLSEGAATWTGLPSLRCCKLPCTAMQSPICLEVSQAMEHKRSV